MFRRKRNERRNLEADEPLIDWLVPLIGYAYAQYFRRAHGPPEQWPTPARRKYGAYAERALPDNIQVLHVITTRPMQLSLFDSHDVAPGKAEVPIGVFAGCGPHRLLVFRGTVSGNEWVQDAFVDQVPFIGKDRRGHHEPMGRVHRGFADLFNELHPAVRDLSIPRKRWPWQKPEGRLWIAGHSLGGALACLSALLLSRENPIVYTLASPRVGDHNFARSFRANIERAYRIANTNDPFTNLPNEEARYIDGRTYRYEHVGEAVPIHMDRRSVVRGIIASRDLIYAHQLTTYEAALRDELLRDHGVMRSRLSSPRKQ